jgi:hypothetical protein
MHAHIWLLPSFTANSLPELSKALQDVLRPPQWFKEGGNSLFPPNKKDTLPPYAFNLAIQRQERDASNFRASQSNTKVPNTSHQSQREALPLPDLDEEDEELPDLQMDIENRLRRIEGQDLQDCESV